MKRIREEEKRITQRNKRKKLDILFIERNTQKIYSLIEKSIALSKKHKCQQEGSAATARVAKSTTLKVSSDEVKQKYTGNV